MCADRVDFLLPFAAQFGQIVANISSYVDKPIKALLMILKLNEYYAEVLPEST